MKKVAKPKKQFVFVFVDYDHNTVEVFTKLKDAKELGWNDEEEDWHKSTKNTWSLGEYCFIYKREVS